MKKIFFLVSILSSFIGFSQSGLYLRADSTFIMKGPSPYILSGNNELNLFNGTRTKNGAFLQNYNNGRTRFAYAVDSVWKDGDSLVIRRGDTTIKINVGSGGGGSMVYPGAGIALSTGSGWGTSITDNSSNWNTAFGWGNHASAGYVPGARTLTINGTTYDLTTNRSWTISTPTLQQVTDEGNQTTLHIGADHYRVWPTFSGSRYTSSPVALLDYAGNGVNAVGQLTLREMSDGTGNIAVLQPLAMASDISLYLPEGNDGDTLATKAYARSVGGGGGGSSLRFGKAGEDATAAENRVFDANNNDFIVDSSSTFKFNTKKTGLRWSQIDATYQGINSYSAYDGKQMAGIAISNGNNVSEVLLESQGSADASYHTMSVKPDSIKFTTANGSNTTIKFEKLPNKTTTSTDSLALIDNTGKFYKAKPVVVDLTGASVGDHLIWDGTEVTTTSATAEGTHGLTRFTVGAAGAPVNGATSYTNTEYIGRRVEPYIVGYGILDSSASDGYAFNSSTGQITFAHALTTGQTVIIKDYAATQIIYRTVSGGGGGGGGLVDLDFPTNVGLSNSSGVWTGTTGSGGDYANKGLSDKKLLGTSDGYIQFQFAASDAQNAILGMNVTNSNVAYGSMQYGAYVYSTTIYAVDNGTPTTTSTSISAGDYLKIEVVGTTVKLYKSPDGSTWGSSIYTFSRARGEDLYINTNVDLSYKLYYPKGYNLN